jgi:Dyp-type peroxidase family
MTMAVTPSTLSKPIDWTQQSLQGLLNDLQANILKGHGRDATKNIFLQFDSKYTDKAKKFVNDLGAQVTSALTQLQATANFKSTGKSGGPIVLFFLTAKGYQALGLPASKIPSDAAFQNGMAVSQPKLNDPPKSQWDPHFGQDIHALLLIADEDEFGLNNEVDRIRTLFPSQGVKVLGEEMGVARRNKRGEGIEHFGYVDGRSQPLMLQEDVNTEDNEKGGTSVWDPRFGPDQVLVKCPGGETDDSYGSYFVFRKLEQRVQGFKTKEQELADAMGLVGDDRERAGALVVGRFEDGTPVVMRDEAKDLAPVFNNFNYANDPNALRCPFQGHIRKANPRGESATKIPGVTVAQERSHIMARRGITYGKRYDDGSSIPVMPNGSVGLLFMAYQKDIANQFEFTQQTWVNNDNFVTSGTGTDPVIGQSPQAQSQKWRKNWDSSSSPTVNFGFQGFVTLKGGEYFFAPSLSCLKNI